MAHARRHHGIYSLDEVGEAALLGGQLGLLEADSLRNVGVEPPDLLLDLREHVADVLRRRSAAVPPRG